MSTEATLHAQVAAHESWAQTRDRAARTSPGRQALLAKFELQADPNGVLAPAERAARAASLRKAYFSRLALLSAQSRRKARELLAEADQVDAERADLADHAGLVALLSELGL